jgi:hypothetical protein
MPSTAPFALTSQLWALSWPPSLLLSMHIRALSFVSPPQPTIFTGFHSISSSHSLCSPFCMARASLKSFAYYLPIMQLQRRQAGHGLLYPRLGYSMAVYFSRMNGLRDTRLRLYTLDSLSWCVLHLLVLFFL